MNRSGAAAAPPPAPALGTMWSPCGRRPALASYLSILWGASSSTLNGLFSHRFRNSRKFNVMLSLRPRRPRRRWNSSSFRLKSRCCSSRWRSCIVMTPSLSVSILKKAAYGSWSRTQCHSTAPRNLGPPPTPALCCGLIPNMRDGRAPPVAFFGDFPAPAPGVPLPGLAFPGR